MAQGTASRTIFDIQSSRSREAQDERHKRKLVMLDNGSMTERSSLDGLCPLYGPTGTLCMILSVPLPETRRRKTDSSIIIKAAELKRNLMVRGECKKIKRAKGVERQWRWNCPDSGMTLAYQAKAWDAEAPFVYVLPDAVSADALWGTREALRGVEQLKLPDWLEGRDGGARVELEIITGSQDTELDGPSSCGSRLVLRLCAPAQEDERNRRLLDWASAAFEVDHGRVSIDWSARGTTANSVVLVFGGVDGKPRRILAKAEAMMSSR